MLKNPGSQERPQGQLHMMTKKDLKDEGVVSNWSFFWWSFALGLALGWGVLTLSNSQPIVSQSDSHRLSAEAEQTRKLFRELATDSKKTPTKQ